MKDGWVLVLMPTIQILWKDSKESAFERETENLKSQFVELSPDFPVRHFEFKYFIFSFCDKNETTKVVKRFQTQERRFQYLL